MEVLNSGSNIITVRENNLSVVIRLIYKAKVCSRAELAKATGLKQATITNIINDLISWGLVFETGYIPGAANRRSVGIAINNAHYKTIGLRLNRDYVSAGLFDITGNMLERREYKFNPHSGPEEVVRQMQKFIKEFNAHHEADVLGVGVAIPGPFVVKHGKIALMSGFPGWENVDIKAELGEHTPAPVFLEHDANCGVLAEMWYGDISEFKDVIYIASDIGVGAGILVSKRLYTGGMGMAGEIGHMTIDYGGPLCECGNRGCLELYCSTHALLQEYKKELLHSLHETDHQEESTVEQILKAVASGDKTARNAFARVAQYLGIGLVSVINSFNPELIILSDKIAIAGEYLLQIVDDVLRERLLKPAYENTTVRLGSFVEDGMLYGASALVLENLLQQPTVYFKPDM